MGAGADGGADIGLGGNQVKDVDVFAADGDGLFPDHLVDPVHGGDTDVLALERPRGLVSERHHVGALVADVVAEVFDAEPLVPRGRLLQSSRRRRPCARSSAPRAPASGRRCRTLQDGWRGRTRRGSRGVRHPGRRPSRIRWSHRRRGPGHRPRYPPRWRRDQRLPRRGSPAWRSPGTAPGHPRRRPRRTPRCRRRATMRVACPVPCLQCATLTASTPLGPPSAA